MAVSARTITGSGISDFNVLTDNGLRLVDYSNTGGGAYTISTGTKITMSISESMAAGTTTMNVYIGDSLIYSDACTYGKTCKYIYTVKTHCTISAYMETKGTSDTLTITITES